jgi:hypothetical protein
MPLNLDSDVGIEGVISNPVQELSAEPNASTDSTCIVNMQQRRCIVISLIRHAQV